MAGVRIRKDGVAKFMKVDLRAVAERLQRTIEEQIRIRAKGRIAARVSGSKISVRGRHIRFKVWSKTGFSLYPDQGTGIYAGRGHIYPRTAQALVFQPKGSARVIFARRIKGQPAQHFMRNGLFAGIRLL